MHDMAASVAAIIKQTHGITLPHQKLETKVFSNGEHWARLTETIRRQHVFFFHGMQFGTPNEALMDMLIAANAMKYASVASITLVVPYMSYLRQDRKDKPRVPITARLVADLIEVNRKIEHVITMDMHAEQAQGFFSIPVDNMSSERIFIEYIQNEFMGRLAEIVVVAPDFGSAKRARKFAEKLGIKGQVAIIEKNRPEANMAEVLSLIGASVRGKIALMYDDMIDTGGTIAGGTKELLSEQHGAKQVLVMATHGILSSEAGIAKLVDSGGTIAVTNSIPRELPAAFTMVPIDAHLAKVIYENTLVGGSVSRHS
jgi:ribose-phosphate pyrophosphokinase